MSTGKYEYRGLNRATRNAVLERDKFRCQLDGPRCLNKKVPAGVPLHRRFLHIHHVEHRAAGGRHGEAKKESDSEGNLTVLCINCHQDQHQRPWTLEGWVSKWNWVKHEE